MDLTVKRGDTLKILFPFTYDNGDILNLSGCIAKLYLKYLRTGDLIINATTENALLTINEELGLIELEVPAPLMLNVPLGRHEYDLKVEFPDGIIYTTETQYLNVIRDVTSDNNLINISGYSGFSGVSRRLSWIDYAFNWIIEPELIGLIPQGEVHKYTYNNTIAYRLIPTDNVSIDSFYANFSGSTLTNLLAERGNL